MKTVIKLEQITLRLLTLYILNIILAIIVVACQTQHKNNPKVSANKQEIKGLCLAGKNTNGLGRGYHCIRERENRAFGKRARYLSDSLKGWGFHQVSAAADWITILENETRKQGVVGSGVIFSHGDEWGIFFDDSCGFYHTALLKSSYLQKSYGGNPKQRTAQDLLEKVKAGKIKFDPESIWALLSCTSAPVAKEICGMIHIPVIGVSKYLAPLNAQNNKQETGSHVTNGQFILYLPAHQKSKAFENQTVDSLLMGDIFDPQWYFLQPYFMRIKGVHG